MVTDAICLGQLEVDEDVGPGQQLSAGIVDVHFDEQRAGGEVDRVGRPHQRAVERPPGELLERERRGAPGASRSRVDLGDGDEDAERVDGRHVKELPTRGVRARIDQDPDVRLLRAVMTPSNGAYDLLEPLELLEPADVRGVRVDGGLHCAERAYRLVRLLLGDRVALQ